MKPTIFNILLSGLILSACGTPGTPVPELPKDAAIMTFRFKTESFQRGLNANINGIPKFREHAIIDVTYILQCQSNSTPSAKSRFSKAQKILIDSYKVAPIFYDNPREPTQWSASASRKTVEQTGCQVKAVSKAVKTTDPTAVLRWSRDHNFLPEHIALII